MEAVDVTAIGQKAVSRNSAAEKALLQRKWVSEPPAVIHRCNFTEQELQERLSPGAIRALVPQQCPPVAGNSGKLLTGCTATGAIGASGSLDSPETFAQVLPQGYAHPVGQPYSKHPQTEDKLSGAQPQPHAWPFAGQLPSDDLCVAKHTHPRGGNRMPRQKSPSLPSAFGQYSQSLPEPESFNKKEQKPKKPGKYICHYCGRACAKPSVLKKHIRSHTGERPYPCDPCGFSFKTKSNLYKHRKSHAHAIKAGLVPFADLAIVRSGDMDPVEVHTDGDQSTDTDEELPQGSTVQMDKGCPVPQITAGGGEPAYADSAEELPVGSMRVPILIVPKPGLVPSEDMKASHFRVTMKGNRRGHSLDDSPHSQQRSTQILNDKKSLDCDLSQSLNLLSPHSKGSTDSGYFSRSESAEQQVSPPNTNIKTYEEIMFGRNWYYRPNARARPPVTANLTVSDPSFVSLTASGAFGDVGKIAEDQICLSGEAQISGESKLCLAGPIQSSSGLLELPSESGNLIRSNSMPASSPSVLAVPAGLRGSQSFDEMISSDHVFYRSGLRRLRRQVAIELSAHESQLGEGLRAADSSPNVTDPATYFQHGKRVSVSELVTRKRRIEKTAGEEEDSLGHCDSSCSGSLEIYGDFDYGSRATSTVQGSLQSVHSQSDSFETCTSMCSEDAALISDLEGRKAVGNVISVIQHTNSLSRPSSFEKSESFELLPHLPSGLSSQHSEHSDSDIFEDALGPESVLLNAESMEQQGDNDPVVVSSRVTSPGHPYHLTHKLVRQPNIQVPEIRVTEEPDKLEKDLEERVPKEQHAEEFQLPQRSDTLAQMPSEKLPPKKKRLRLADMEHSSGESSFESTCTSLSRSPSQESNLSHSSSFSMSFDREESLKSLSLTKQDDSIASGVKQSEFLTVPASGHSGHHQQREMQRSSSEQAPCPLPLELPEMRSKSFDYGSLSASRQGELCVRTSGQMDRRRGLLVRQASLSVHPEANIPELTAETPVKQEWAEAAWPGTAAPSLTCDVVWRGSGPSVPGVHLLRHGERGLPDPPLLPPLLQHQSCAAGVLPGAEVFWSLKPGHTLKLSQHQVQTPHSQPPSFSCGPQIQDSKGDTELCDSPVASRPNLLWLGAQSQSRSPTVVPVRIQTDIPLLGSAMYTSVSQLVAQGDPGPEGLESNSKLLARSPSGSAVNLAFILGQELKAPSAEPLLNTGIPPSLTSGTVSITDASGLCPGSSKQFLSHANSMEQFFQSRQQKRVREERMYGQILKEMSAVELSGGVEQEGPQSCEKRMSSSPPAKIPVPVRSLAPSPQQLTQPESFAPPLLIVTDQSTQSCGPNSPKELDVDAVEPDSGMVGGANILEHAGGSLARMVVLSGPDAGSGAGGQTLFVPDIAETQHMFRFPSLRTTSQVSWCFLNYTKPSSHQVGPRSSIYSSWTVSAYDPNPLNLSTKTALAQLRSKQRQNTELLFTTASLSSPGCGRLVSSANWRPRLDQLKPKSALAGGGGSNLKVATQAKDEKSDKEGPVRPAVPEPARIKIFDGGYKSNEDYVYVRGRGRGKYICEECGIRCKKPSMLKKHIRTHTDVRPYVCKFCNFAFKTKGNLTKHMKSKAHLKKCLELGVSTQSMEEAEEPDEGQRSEVLLHIASEHQFSDADDSEGPEDEGDEVDDEDEEDEEYDGDSMLQTHSRSCSPQPLTFPAPSVVASHNPDFQSGPDPPSLFGYFTTVPSIEITLQDPPTNAPGLDPGQGLQGAPSSGSPPASMDEDMPLPSPNIPSRLSSPGLDLPRCASPTSPASSPSSRRYLAPHRDLSPLQGQLSPRCILSPLRHVSPRRRDASPRRGHPLLLYPSSPSTRDYCRDISPKGRHKGPIRPLSPRRGLHHCSQQSGVRGLRLAGLAGPLGTLDSGYQCQHRGSEVDRDYARTLSEDRSGTRSEQSSPQSRGLFSHLPLHSQLQERPPFPMIPIGGIQMVHSVPSSGASPLSQQGALKSGTTAVWEAVVGGATLRGEQEDNIHTCTWAIASLCINSEEKTAHSGPAPHKLPTTPGVEHFIDVPPHSATS